MEINTLREDKPIIKVSEEKSTHQLRILIVDDDITSEILWNIIISKIDEKAHISWATSFIEAEHKIKTSIESCLSYDIIITDIFLSGSNTGIDLWHKYHKILKKRMILVSAVDPNKLSQHMGDIDEQPIFLHKPLDFAKCINVINGLIPTM